MVISGLTREMNCLHSYKAELQTVSDKKLNTAPNNTVHKNVKTFQKLSSKMAKVRPTRENHDLIV